MFLTYTINWKVLFRIYKDHFVKKLEQFENTC